LILRKIIKTVATRCQILRLKCTKIQNSAGVPPQTPLGERSPDLLAGLKGPTSKGRGGSGGYGRGRGRDGKGGEWRGGECCGVQKILKIDPAVGSCVYRKRNCDLQPCRRTGLSCSA